MPKKPIRIPITNVLNDGDYCAKFFIGAKRKAVNVLLDTGSSSFAVDHRSYDPEDDSAAEITRFAQNVVYGDGSSWTGSVVRSSTSLTRNPHGKADVKSGSIAVVYRTVGNPFGKGQGILGLAFKSVDVATRLSGPSVPPTYLRARKGRSGNTSIEPFFSELARTGEIAKEFALYTRRSFPRASRDPARSPLNRGWLILGGGEEAKDLYRGDFQSAVIRHKNYYCVRLKQIIVGDREPVKVPPPRRGSGSSTNAIVDSGTNTIDFCSIVFAAVLSKFTPDQRKLLRDCGGGMIPASKVSLDEWPIIVFVLEGTDNEVRLALEPQHYLQSGSTPAGGYACCVTHSRGDRSTLGLPLLNAYFTIFDRSGRDGVDVVKFARRA